MRLSAGTSLGADTGSLKAPAMKVILPNATVSEDAHSNINTIGDRRAEFLPKVSAEHEKGIQWNEHLQMGSEAHLDLEICWILIPQEWLPPKNV